MASLSNEYYATAVTCNGDPRTEGLPVELREGYIPGCPRAFIRHWRLRCPSQRARIRARFEAARSKGLCVAFTEGVSTLDRLGSYCFTGLSRSLMGSVLQSVGTIKGIE
ncbi:hypothetical protein T440DRAFT_473563 [Plenodomus tracheiphilus IPT5]|uniref:Uncharacterized protein n=1 Tax=Plenodomus tracheiphilus IPT5 TaxID=1408161 RepID=A0A6A7AM54_9PLEO|nr:hypothetical protein T440DRAFT_473563 [Plenodomus tracheiphilus IPT5]